MWPAKHAQQYPAAGLGHPCLQGHRGRDALSDYDCERMSEHELCLRINMLATAYIKRRCGEWQPRCWLTAQGIKLPTASDKWEVANVVRDVPCRQSTA